MRRSATLIAAICATASVAAPAFAETLNADAARSFVAGRTFAYRCYEGSVGSGRIQADGSVMGTIQLRGQGSPRYVTLPAGTLMARGPSVCAKLKGVAFQPCFQVEKTSDTSFRGNLAGFDRMWCEFERGGTGRNKLAARRVKEQPPVVQAAAKTAPVQTASSAPAADSQTTTTAQVDQPN